MTAVAEMRQPFFFGAHSPCPPSHPERERRLNMLRVDQLAQAHPDDSILCLGMDVHKRFVSVTVYSGT